MSSEPPNRPAESPEARPTARVADGRRPDLHPAIVRIFTGQSGQSGQSDPADPYLPGSYTLGEILADYTRDMSERVLRRMFMTRPTTAQNPRDLPSQQIPSAVQSETQIQAQLRAREEAQRAREEAQRARESSNANGAENTESNSAEATETPSTESANAESANTETTNTETTNTETPSTEAGSSTDAGASQDGQSRTNRQSRPNGPIMYYLSMGPRSSFSLSEHSLRKLKRLRLAEVPAEDRKCSICYEDILELPDDKAAEQEELNNPPPQPPRVNPFGSSPESSETLEAPENETESSQNPGNARNARGSTENSSAAGSARDHSGFFFEVAAPPYVRPEDPDEDHYALKLPCGHIFGNACIRLWLNSNITCPLCRVRIEPPDPDRTRLTRVPFFFDSPFALHASRQQRMNAQQSRNRNGTQPTRPPPAEAPEPMTAEERARILEQLEQAGVSQNLFDVTRWSSYVLRSPYRPRNHFSSLRRQQSEIMNAAARQLQRERRDGVDLRQNGLNSAVERYVTSNARPSGDRRSAARRPRRAASELVPSAGADIVLDPVSARRNNADRAAITSRSTSDNESEVASNPTNGADAETTGEGVVSESSAPSTALPDSIEEPASASSENASSEGTASETASETAADNARSSGRSSANTISSALAAISAQAASRTTTPGNESSNRHDDTDPQPQPLTAEERRAAHIQDNLARRWRRMQAMAEHQDVPEVDEPESDFLDDIVFRGDDLINDYAAMQQIDDDDDMMDDFGQVRPPLQSMFGSAPAFELYFPNSADYALGARFDSFVDADLFDAFRVHFSDSAQRLFDFNTGIPRPPPSPSPNNTQTPTAQTPTAGDGSREGSSSPSDSSAPDRAGPARRSSSRQHPYRRS